MPVITNNIAEVKAALGRLVKNQVPQATAWALNATAYDAFGHLQNTKREVFDRPKKWTLNAFYVWPAKKRNLKAIVQEKNSVGRKHHLKVLGAGGARPLKGFERLIAARTGIKIGAALPAKGARLDQYGNWSDGQRNQVLSALGAQRDVGVTSNQTARSRARNRKRASYFVPKAGSKLAPGVYKREQGSRDLEMVLMLAPGTPNYRKMIDYHDVIMAKAAQVYQAHFIASYKKAIATAR